MRIIPCFLLIACLLWANFIKAQILKTDRISVRADTARAIIGSLNLGFDFQNRSLSDTQENISRSLDLNSDMAVLLENTAFVFINNLNYLSVSNATPLSTGYSHFRLIYNRKATLSPELFSQVQYDESRTMKLRFLQGAGLKWTLLDKSGFDLHFGPGLMWEYEDWTPEGTVPTVKKLWKSTNFLGVNTRLSPSVQVHFINYYQVGKDGDVWRSRVSGDIWLEMNIHSNFSFTTKYSMQYENNPVIDIRKKVTQFSTGLEVKF